MGQYGRSLLSLLCLVVFVLGVVAVPSSTLHFDHPAPHEPSRSDNPCDSGLWQTITGYVRSVVWSDPVRDPAYAQLEAELPMARGPGPSKHYGQVVVRFNITTVAEVESLKEASEILFLDVWEASWDWVDIRLAKDVLPSLLGLLPDTLQRSHHALLQGPDLAKAVADTFPTSSHPTDTLSPFQTRKLFTPSSKTTHGNEFFREYRPFSVMSSWMRLLQTLFPSHVQLVNVGHTWQGRDIPGLRVGVRPVQGAESTEPRRTIIVSGGSHAREWISTSTVNYILYSMVIGYGRNQRISRLLDSMDFVFVPTLNPDGYIYSWEVDRLWRKTRQPSPIRFCQGLDLDRSWGFHWGTDRHARSANPCSEDYAGEEPFESVEARSFAGWLRNETTHNNVSIVSMVDLHSYSESILLPYSFSCSNEPPALEDLEEVGEGIARAIRRTYGEDYDVVSACEGNMVPTTRPSSERLPRIQSAGGSPLDWFYHELRVKYSYQIKLRDTGSYGFLLPPEWIVPQGEEILNAILYLGKSVGGASVENDALTQNYGTFEQKEQAIVGG